VVEDTYGSAPVGVRYWTSVAEYVTALPEDVATVLARVSRLLADSPAAIGLIAGEWPVVWESERGRLMRWLSVIFRGELGGGVEQFQHHIDIGNPGGDPDITAVAGLALAEQMAGIWSTVFNGSYVSNDVKPMFPTHVKYLEVGVVQKTQTEGTDAAGQGGNLAQSWDTQWYGYPTASRPVGTGAGTLPFEVAAAVTFRSEHRGPSGRGRMYLPPLAGDRVGTDGLFTATTTTVLATAMGDLCQKIEDNTPYVPVVVSRRRIILNQITEVSMGRVPDAQRRRRRSQDEAPIVGWTHS
jgi:hypothetical protein